MALKFWELIIKTGEFQLSYKNRTTGKDAYAHRNLKAQIHNQVRNNQSARKKKLINNFTLFIYRAIELRIVLIRKNLVNRVEECLASCLRLALFALLNQYFLRVELWSLYKTFSMDSSSSELWWVFHYYA